MVGEVGMFPQIIQCHKDVLVYLQRLNNLPEGSVSKSVFMESKTFSLLGFRTCYIKANELAKFYGLELTGTSDPSDFSQQAVKAIIENHHIESWRKKLQDTENFPILRTYRLLKRGF